MVLKGKKPFPTFLLALTLLLMIIFSGTFLLQPVYAYDNLEYGFSINAPTDWRIQEHMEPMIVSFTDYLDTRATMSVLVSDSMGGDLDRTVEGFKALQPKLGDSFAVVSEGILGVGRLNGYQIDYTLTLYGSEMRFTQAFFVEDGTTFIITCGVSPSNYTLVSSDFEQSIRSFQITSDAQTATKPENTLVYVGAGIVILVLVAVAMVLFFKLRLKPLSPSVDSSPPLDS